MNQDDLQLASVHWEHGMMLLPDHFLRQERYIDSSVLWVLRYASTPFGLVGSGPRLAEGELRPAEYNPEVSVLKEGAANWRIDVTSCRGITSGGGIVDYRSRSDVAAIFTDEEIKEDATVYVTAAPHEKTQFETSELDYDGEPQIERRQNFRVVVHPPQEMLAWSLAVARIIRVGNDVHADPNYIPPCAFMSGHSGLIQASMRLEQRLEALAERFAALHRAMRDTLPVAQKYGIMAELGLDEITFAGRMVVALQECLYDIADPAQTPAKFFGHFRKLLHLSTIFLDLSVQLREYFRDVQERVRMEFVDPVNAHSERLKNVRQPRINADLSLDVKLTEDALRELEKLEEGLESKYVDFRYNTIMPSLKFFFDNDILYRLVDAKRAARGSSAEVVTSFRSLANLSAERVGYRIILAGQVKESTYDDVEIDISVNDASFGRSPKSVRCSGNGQQFNFSFDFKSPDGQAINDLTVRYPAGFNFQSVMLFEEHRLASVPQTPGARTIQPDMETRRFETNPSPAPGKPGGRIQPSFDVKPRVAPDPRRAPGSGRSGNSVNRRNRIIED